MNIHFTQHNSLSRSGRRQGDLQEELISLLHNAGVSTFEVDNPKDKAN